MDLEKYISGKQLFDDHYRLIKLLSEEGGSADVWLAENNESIDTTFSEEDDDVVKVEGTGVLVAIKIYRPKNILDVEGEQLFKQEFKTIFNCHHTNLIPTTDYSICDGMPYLVMPFCENGSAEKLIGKLSTPKDIWKFIYDTASGLEYLHACSPQIIHQDIKPANILIDANHNYCITDFGISVKSGIQDDSYYDNLTSGTSHYMAPERFNDDYKPSPSSDIWSLGITICELIIGDCTNNDPDYYLQKLKERKIPSDISNLIKKCLSKDPTKRPTAHDIVELSREKIHRKRPIQRFMWMVFIVLLLLSCSLFLYKNIVKTNHAEKKDFLEIFAENTWVCDHPEVPIWEEWTVPMSGVVLYSYEYYHVKEKVVCKLKAVPDFSPIDSSLNMQCDTLPSVPGKITNYSKYEFTWKTENGPFTYNRVLGTICGKINDIIDFDASSYLSEDIISCDVNNKEIINLIQNNRKIKILKEGRTYIRIETDEGTALVRIDCNK